MPQSVLLKILGKTYIKEILVVVVFLLICEKFLIMLNMISCWLNVNSMAYVVSQIKSFFFDRKQFVSNKASIKYGVQRESVP